MRLPNLFHLVLLILSGAAVSCQVPQTPAPSLTRPGTVEVRVGGLGTEPDRGIINDSSVAKVDIFVTDSLSAPVGSGTLTKMSPYWGGNITVTVTGPLTFTARAENSSQQVVYQGSQNLTVTGAGDSVSIAVSTATLLGLSNPLTGRTDVGVRNTSGQELLDFTFRFSASIDPLSPVTLTFTQPPRVYKVGANSGKTGHPLEEEAVFTFSQTICPNDTLTVKPVFGYAAQTYSAPVLAGLQIPGGLPLGSLSVPAYSVATTSVPLTNQVSDWRDRVVYFALTDRFSDGDSSNNQWITTGNADSVATDGKTYQGGDFKGMAAKLPYLKNLGITALWITSPVRQSWENATYTSYHGYWAQDFYAVDPHLGTMKDFRDLVKDAHSQGIAVVMDVVVNHVGPLSFYDLNADGQPGAGEWEPAFSTTAYSSHQWLEAVTPPLSWAWNANRLTPYFGPLPEGKTIADFVTRKGGNATAGAGSEVTDGDFAGLRDVNTSDTAVKQRLTSIFEWWIANTDIDGYRIDTVKHVQDAFWTSFCADLRSYAAGLTTTPAGGKKLYTLAEVYDGSATGVGSFTKTGMLDSVLGFPMADEVFDWNSSDNVTVFKDSGTWSGRPKTSSLETTLSDLAGDANLALSQSNSDGNSARQKIGYFLDNHDLNRFLNGTSGTDNEGASAGEVSNLQMALSWLLTWEGIPVLYYGTEQVYKQSLALTNHGEHGDGVGFVNKGNRPNLWQVTNTNNGSTAFSETHDLFLWIKGLTSLRTLYPALGKGTVSIKWTDNGTGSTNDDGILAFVRSSDSNTTDEDILVVINTNPNQYSAASAGSGNDLGTDWPVATSLTVVAVPGFTGTGTSGTSQIDTDGGTGQTWASTTTTFSQAGKTSAVYFQVPPNSIRLLRKTP